MAMQPRYMRGAMVDELPVLAGEMIAYRSAGIGAWTLPTE